MILIFIINLPGPAAAGPRWAEAGQGDRVAIDLPVDAALVGVGLAGIVVPELLKQNLAPPRCRWCDGPDNTGLPDDPASGRGTLNGLDAFFHDALTGALFVEKPRTLRATCLSAPLRPCSR